jgi:hypothetical protein
MRKQLVEKYKENKNELENKTVPKEECEKT